MSDIQLKKLCELTGDDPRQIHRIADAGFITKPEKKGQYDREAAIRGVVAYYKAQAARVTESKAFDAARREKAEADTAEIESADKAGKLMLKSDARLIWADATIEVRRAIEGADFLNSIQAQKLLLTLSRIRPPEIT